MAVVTEQLQHPAGEGLEGFEATFDCVGRHPTVTLYAEPDDNAYRRIVAVPFGELIYLPTPFDVDLDTSQFLR